VVVSGEVHWWCPSLDDTGNGTTTLNDRVGSRNGTLTNFALSGTTSNWTADTGSGGIRAIASDGVNDIITMSSIASLSGDIFWCAWIKPASTGRDACILATRNIFTGAARSGIALYWRDANGNNIAAEVVLAGTRYTAILNTTLALNTWYWVYGERNGTTGVVTVGVDGVGTATASGTTATITHETGPCICSWRDYTIGSFPGRVDDLRIFNKRPTNSERTAMASKRGYV